MIEHSKGPIWLEDAKLVVQPGGHKRVFQERKKNVHTYVKGVQVKPKRLKAANAIRPHYDPHIVNYWHEKNNLAYSIYKARWLKLTTENNHAIVLAWK